MPPTIVALIPARSGSKRLPHKNVMRLGEHPLLAYAIAAALESAVFRQVVVSTDSERYAEVAKHYGADVLLRPSELATETSPDIEWIRHALSGLSAGGKSYECFSILRPTSPCRKAATIRRAWEEFISEPAADSLRAVERCRQHPGKMWVVRGRRMHPLMPFGNGGTPWHSSQYANLPPVYEQNASLEIAWARVVKESGTIAGDIVMPFFTEGDEGLDVNDGYDWRVVEQMIRDGAASLPAVKRPPFSGDALP